MTQEQLIRLGIQVYATVIAESLALIPNIKDILKENKRIAFYEEAFFNNLDHNDDLILLSVKEEDMRNVTRELTKNGWAFTVVKTEGLKNAEFHTKSDNGIVQMDKILDLKEPYTIILNGGYETRDLDRVLTDAYKDRIPEEKIEEEQEEQEQGQEIEEELERERTAPRTASSAAEDKETKKEHEQAFEEPDAGEDDGSDKKKEAKKQSGKRADRSRISTPSNESGRFGNMESSGNRAYDYKTGERGVSEEQQKHDEPSRQRPAERHDRPSPERERAESSSASGHESHAHSAAEPYTRSTATASAHGPVPPDTPTHTATAQSVRNTPTRTPEEPQKPYSYDKVHMSTASAKVLEAKTGRERWDYRNDPVIIPEEKRSSGSFDPSKNKSSDPYSIPYDTTAATKKGLAASGKDIAKDAARTDVKRLGKYIRKTVEDAATGDTDGARELKKYKSNTAPIAVYLMSHAKYERMKAAVMEHSFDEDFYCSVITARAGVTGKAKDELIDKTKDALKTAGIPVSGNIWDAEKAFRDAYDPGIPLDHVSKESLKEYLDNSSLSESTKAGINSYANGLKSSTDIRNLKTMIYTRRDELKGDSTVNTLINLRHDLKKIIQASERQSEFIKCLTDMGVPAELVEKFKELDFGAIKSALEQNQTAEIDRLVEMINEFGKGAGLKEYDDICKLAKDFLESKNLTALGDLLSNLSDEKFAKLLMDLKVSDELMKELNAIGPKELSLNVKKLEKLLKKFSGRDAEVLNNILQAQKVRIMQDPSAGKLIKGLGGVVMRTAFKGTDGANAMWDLYGQAKMAGSLYRAGIKLSLKVTSGMAGPKGEAISSGLKAAEHPAKFVVGKAGEKVLKTKIGTSLANSRFAVRLKHSVATARRITGAPRRFMIKTSRAALKGVVRLPAHIINGAKQVMMVFKAAGHGITALFSSAASSAGGAVGAAVGAAGIPALIVVGVTIVAILIISAVSDDKKDTEISNYDYVEFDSDFEQDIVNELQTLNNSFNEQVMKAASDRGLLAASGGFSEGDSVTFYEDGTYKIYYRDDLGNELEDLDINNTKDILSLASSYIKYAGWGELSENASDEEKRDYEQIKQYYIDYCKFLWVSTHRIEVDEYRPGNEKYADADESGLSVDQSSGTCDQNGKEIWLEAGFTVNSVPLPGSGRDSIYTYIRPELDTSGDEGKQLCEDCGWEDFDGKIPSYAKYYDAGANALCTHPAESKEHTGWHRVPNGDDYEWKWHYNCNSQNGHYCKLCSRHNSDGSDGDCDGSEHVYHMCGEICEKTGEPYYIEAHRHKAYRWVYDCGGHMGAVIYVTVGNVSRLMGMDAAKDVDYTTVNPDKSENTDTTDTTEG